MQHTFTQLMSWASSSTKPPEIDDKQKLPSNKEHNWKRRIFRFKVEII